MSGTTYDPQEWPHGLRCAECDRLFEANDRYTSRPLAMTTFEHESAFVLEIVCAPCAPRSAASRG